MKLLTEQQQETVEQLFAIVGSADEYLNKATLEKSYPLCSLYTEFRKLWERDEYGNTTKFVINLRELVNQFIAENNLSDLWVCLKLYLFGCLDYDLAYSRYSTNSHRQIRYQFLQWLETKLKQL